MSQQQKETVINDAQVQQRLTSELPTWQLNDNHLQRHYKTGGWKASLMLVNAIGHLAELAWHHPEMELAYSQVTVNLQTHSAGGITDKDFELATKIETFITWQPGYEPGALDGLPDNPRYDYIKPD